MKRKRNSFIEKSRFFLLKRIKVGITSSTFAISGLFGETENCIRLKTLLWIGLLDWNWIRNPFWILHRAFRKGLHLQFYESSFEEPCEDETMVGIPVLMQNGLGRLFLGERSGFQLVPYGFKYRSIAFTKQS